MSFQNTAEQDAIISAVRSSTDSLMINALAGTGKTTTIQLAFQTHAEPCMAVAFNVKNKKDMEKKLPGHFSVKTLNGLGHTAWAQSIGKKGLGVDEDKLFNMLKEMAPKDLAKEQFTSVLALVKAARHSGLIPASFGKKGLIPDEYETWENFAWEQMLDVSDNVVFHARKLLTASITAAYKGVIDYDDQIYMSALFGGLFPRFNTVIVDEAQDLSPLNHIQLRRMMAKRYVVVGDPRQAIYAFRGASSDSMEKMRELSPNWIDLSLTTTFRCSKAVVRRVNDFIPEFNAAEANAEGQVLNYHLQEWDWSAVPKDRGKIAILSRNNAPIIAMAFKLIQRGIGAQVLGRDIGKTLITLVKKVCGENNELPVHQCIEKIQSWIENEIAKARAKKQESKIATIHDRGNSLMAVANLSGAKTLGDIQTNLLRIFADEGALVTLSTGHRAKGMEWDVVIHLNPNLIPSKYALAAREEGNPVPYEQDMNLKYVIETRSKDLLMLCHLDDFDKSYTTDYEEA